MTRPTRRGVLGALCLAGAGMLAGCSEETPDDDGPQSATPTDLTTETRTDDSTSSAGSASGTGVPMFRYDAANTGTRLDGQGPTGESSTHWRVDIGGTIRSSPAVADGVVYVGSGDGSVYALDDETGDEVWDVSLDGSVWSSPAVVDGVLYVGTTSGTVHALDAADGADGWEFSAAGPVNGSPAVVDDTVVVGADGGTVHALDVADGRERWRAELPDSVASRGDADSSTVARLSAERGSTTSLQTAATPTSTPAVVDDRAYVASDTSLYALDVADGGEQWAAELGSTARFGRLADDRGGQFHRLQTALSIPSSPAVVDGVVYVGSAPGLTAVDANSGQQLWRAEATADATGPVSSDPPAASLQVATTIDSSPAVAADGVYVGGDGLVGVQRESGVEEWQRTLPSDVQSSPAVVGETVYVGTSDGRVLGLGTASGTEQWVASVDSSVAASPAATDGVVYVGTTGGTLYALR